MINIYAFCDNNCKHLVYTREEVLSLLQQAINDGSLKNIDADYAAVKSVVDSNAGSDITFWTGTEAEFNALNPAPKVNHFIPRRGEDGKIYICIDDTSISNLPTTPLSSAEIKAICDGTYKTGDGDFVDAAGVAALWDQANDSFAVERVGDIKTTLRTTLGDKWALCNGAMVKQEEMPEMYNALEMGAIKKRTPSGNSGWGGVVYFKGYFIAVQTLSSSVRVAVVSDMESAIDSDNYTQLYSDQTESGSYYYYNPKITCSDDKVYITAYYNAGYTVVWSTDDPASGNWVAKSKKINYTSGGYTYNFQTSFCAYKNNMLILAGEMNNQGAVVVCENPDDTSTWTYYIISTSIRANYIFLDYNDGKWVALLDSSSDGNIYVAVADDLAGEWTANQIYKSSDSSISAAGLKYYAGVWYAVIGRSICYATDPLGTWSTHTIGNSQYSAPTASATYSYFDVVDGVFIYGGFVSYSDFYVTIWHTTEPLGEWEVAISSPAITPTISETGVAIATAHGNGMWLTVTDSYGGDGYGCWVYCCKNLPTITHDGAYTYIKAKE